MNAIPGFSPISPMSTFMPLAFVILMSVLREGYEDFVSFYFIGILVSTRPPFINIVVNIYNRIGDEMTA
jgi:hypothetical protein